MGNRRWCKLGGWLQQCGWLLLANLVPDCAAISRVPANQPYIIYLAVACGVIVALSLLYCYLAWRRPLRDDLEGGGSGGHGMTQPGLDDADSAKHTPFYRRFLPAPAGRMVSLADGSRVRLIVPTSKHRSKQPQPHLQHGLSLPTQLSTVSESTYTVINATATATPSVMSIFATHATNSITLGRPRSATQSSTGNSAATPPSAGKHGRQVPLVCASVAWMTRQRRQRRRTAPTAQAGKRASICTQALQRLVSASARRMTC